MDRVPEGQPREILRFHEAERHLHWALAIPFVVCFATAVLLVAVYNPDPSRPLRAVVSWMHRLSGLGLAVLPLWVLLRHRAEAHRYLDNLRRAFTWSLDDVKWLFLMGPATVTTKIALPHQGKFNAAEKINFMVLTATYPVYVLTGLTIWFLRPAYVSWLIHLSLAAVAAPLVLGHLFMALVNPDTRTGLQGMISGFVDRQWARHHYRLWYDEHFGDEPEAATVSMATPVPEAPAPSEDAAPAPACILVDVPLHAD